MDREQTDAAARRWVDLYLTAWRTNDPADIAAAFTPDAEYRNDPWTPPLSGITAITAGWLERADEVGTWEFTWDVAGIDGDRVFVQAETRYDSGTDYSNLWVIDLAEDGRARSFTEWWMDQSDPS